MPGHPVPDSAASRDDATSAAARGERLLLRMLIVNEWCEGRDLNPYVLLRQNLNLVRLPFRHLRVVAIAAGAAEQVSHVFELSSWGLFVKPLKNGRKVLYAA
jgi:hypothetical protein